LLPCVGSVDRVCIDRSSSAELSEAINSMFAWYRNSSICYAYLEDVVEKLPDPCVELLADPELAAHVADSGSDTRDMEEFKSDAASDGSKEKTKSFIHSGELY
jgi:hypothetical protein